MPSRTGEGFFERQRRLKRSHRATAPTPGPAFGRLTFAPHLSVAARAPYASGMSLNKTYDPAAVETRLYEGWETSGAFAADPAREAAPFTIMIPPPNVTGSLHMGHALTFTVQDTLIRWRRMSGRDTLWQPGTDHAGIATQMVVERLLAAEGTDRRALGRDAFTTRVWQWKAESGGTITRQLRRLGASLDWARERFTMDEGLSVAVREAFVTLHEQGLIYRDRRLVNWDPVFQSAISDLEVENREMRGSIWHLAYPLADGDGEIVVATTRPETMLGDTAIAVHPENPRLAHLIGRRAILPLIGRAIPIVADEYSDPEKGTGAVKITPAHDFNDFAVGQRHGLDMPSVIDRAGRITLAEIEPAAVPGIADPEFAGTLEGMDRAAARAAIVAELDRLGLLRAVEPHVNQVPHGDRSGAVIEPLLTTQWFCNAAHLAAPAIASVERGDTAFVPKQWENTFFAWLRDIQPWCISRQLWWGHRIPAWYGPDGQVFVARDAQAAAAAARAAYGHDVDLAQDEDVLDTWFSSGLWPFSTLGWPARTPELARYYPTDVLVTGFDIIFFWVARMMMLGIHLMGEVPFRTVYIHGLVRDARGQKMSKSKGNVLDPLELIDKYGADALRFTICRLTGPGRDVKLGPQVVESYRSFVTKLWNAARFLEMNGIAGSEAALAPPPATAALSLWILAEAHAAVAEATAALEGFRCDDYAEAGYRFVWNVFCDWLLELAKPVFEDAASPLGDELRAVCAHVFGIILRLLHPAMPFVTEELWDQFGYGPPCSLIRAPWPVAASMDHAAEARAEIDWLIRFIGAVRTVRAELNVPPSVRAPILLGGAAPQTWDRLGRWSAAVARLARAAEIGPLESLPKGAAQIVLDEATIVLPLAGLIDIDAERARLVRERARAADEAAKVERKLANSDFVARAKEEVVEENRERLAAAQADMARLDAAIARLG
jgi:valyl-tRNA synthetase